MVASPGTAERAQLPHQRANRVPLGRGKRHPVSISTSKELGALQAATETVNAGRSVRRSKASHWWWVPVRATSGPSPPSDPGRGSGGMGTPLRTGQTYAPPT